MIGGVASQACNEVGASSSVNLTVNMAVISCLSLGGIDIKFTGAEMKQFQPLRFTFMLSCVVLFTACASTSKKAPQPEPPSQISSIDNDAIIALPPRENKSLTGRLAGGAVQGTMLAAKGTAVVAKGAIVGTAKGAEIVAKGAVESAKFGGRAAVGTGEIIVNGTRQTASRVQNGMEFITKAPAANDAASPVGNKTLTDAALSPLLDFNIRKRERPEVLMGLEDEDIYQVELEAGCDWYDVRIAELDDVLGDDYDVEKEKTSTVKKIGKNSRSAALSGVASAAGTYIPGRGIVRALSGAKARQKKTRQIYQKGVARRAFLKGVAMSEGCEGY